LTHAVADSLIYKHTNTTTEKAIAKPCELSPLSAVTVDGLRELLGSMLLLSPDTLRAADYSPLEYGTERGALLTPKSADVPLAILTELRKVQQCHRVHGFMRLMAQHRMLTLNLMLWEWVDNIIFIHSTEQDHWSNPLRIKIQNLLLNPPKDNHTEIHVQEYIPTCRPSRPVFRYNPPRDRRKRYNIEGTWEKLQQVNVVLDAIILQWFDLPVDPNSRAQAYFTREMIDSVGGAALLLDSVWKTASAVAWKLFRNTPRNPTRSDISKWAEGYLHNHPMAQKDKLENTLMADIGVQFQRLAPQASSMLPSMIQGNLVCSTTSLIPEYLPPETTLIGSNTNKTGLHKLLSQMKAVYWFLDHPGKLVECVEDHDLEGKELAKLLNHIQAHADKQLPFRDLAPSRRRILEDGGPFCPKYISTSSGLFSAAIYRGVTHHTDFLIDQERVFHDLSQWNTLVEELAKTKPLGYFCDKNAYGQFSSSQDIANVPAFWAASTNKECSSWLTSTTPINFQDLYNLFLTATIDGKKAFPGFGKLKAFLLAADYAIAGKATTPSPREVGEIIFHIGAGGIKGLRQLGFDCTTATKTGEAFSNVYNFLAKSIPPERKQQMKFGVFLVEHALCKVSRLDTKQFKAVYKRVEEYGYWDVPDEWETCTVAYNNDFPT
jgi:hypothetical protein